MLIHMVQHFAAGFGHDDKVLHAHAKLARQVYARLNGEDHARLYGIGVGGAHIALFVIGLTDKVAQAVVEVLAIARFDDQVTGGGVNIASAASLAWRTRSWMAAYSGFGSPQKNVRVISEQ